MNQENHDATSRPTRQTNALAVKKNSPNKQKTDSHSSDGPHMKAAHQLAEHATVVPAKQSSTLREVLEYSAESTTADCARHGRPSGKAGAPVLTSVRHRRPKNGTHFPGRIQTTFPPQDIMPRRECCSHINLRLCVTRTCWPPHYTPNLLRPSCLQVPRGPPPMSSHKASREG